MPRMGKRGRDELKSVSSSKKKGIRFSKFAASGRISTCNLSSSELKPIQIQASKAISLFLTTCYTKTKKREREVKESSS